jgi:hypothetical protein
MITFCPAIVGFDHIWAWLVRDQKYALGTTSLFADCFGFL